LSEVVGIGKITAIDLIRKYDISSLEDLINKFKKGEIELNEKIQIGLKYVGKFKGKIPRVQVDIIANFIDKTLKVFPDLTITFCGSYRRGLPKPNDIDVLLCDLNLITINDVKQSSLLKDCVKILKDKKFIVDDITSDDITTKYMGFCKFKKNPVRRIDIRLIPVESYYTAISYFTGSYELNKIMRQKAKNLGYKLNEYGLYKDNKMLNVGSEEELFQLLDMEYLPPEERTL
jgi:DNA polymerase/3'-5' exonuclease PolX